MPKNNNIKKEDFPMKIRFGEDPETNYYNSQNNICR